MSRRGWVLGGAAVVLLAGAGGGSCGADREIEVRTLGTGLQCGGAGEGVSARRLRSEDELRAALPAELGAATAAPKVDLAKEAVVLVSAGQRTTAGWAVELAAPKAAVKDRAAGLRVALRGPGEGAVSAQVMTSPCLVVALPSAGLSAVGVLEGDRLLAKVAIE